MTPTKTAIAIAPINTMPMATPSPHNTPAATAMWALAMERTAPSLTPGNPKNHQFNQRLRRGQKLRQQPTGSNDRLRLFCRQQQHRLRHQRQCHQSRRFQPKSQLLPILRRSNPNRNLELYRLEGSTQASCPSDLSSYPPVANERLITTTWHPNYRFPTQLRNPAGPVTSTRKDGSSRRRISTIAKASCGRRSRPSTLIATGRCPTHASRSIRTSGCFSWPGR